jgi:hypothetical protein
MSNKHTAPSFPSMFFAVFMMAGALAGCASDPRDGALGNATFAYRSSRGCAGIFDDGCPVSGSLLTGVTETLEVKVSASDDPNSDLTLVSTAPGVVTVVSSGGPINDSSPHTYQWRVNAAAPGTASLELRRRDGSVLDRVFVRAEDATAIDIVNEDTRQGTLSADAQRLTVRMGAQGSITGFARNARGQRLHGNDAVVWEVAGRAVVELQFGFMQGARVADDHVFVLPRAPGVTRATVRAGSARRELEITVVP